MSALTAPYRPVEVRDVDIAFPASVVHLMPPMDEIPDDFKNFRGPWVDIVTAWFYGGLPKTTTFSMKDGIDGKAMFRHLKCVLGSYEPKHEHKIAAVAFLLSEWCDGIEGWKS